MKNRQDTALVTITKHPDASLAGAKILIHGDGQMYEEAGLPKNVKNMIADRSLPLLNKRLNKTVSFEYDGLPAECYVEVFPVPPHLIVAGAGHVSEPVAQMGKMLDFFVTVVDDRPEFANRSRFPTADEVVCSSYLDYFKHVPINPDTFIVLLTRGHQFDVIILQELLKREKGMSQDERTAYIGMIGSRRRISGVFEQLKHECTDHNFMNIYSPVGLDIGAQTPAEIAVSIMAEILKIKNKASGHSLKENIPSYSQLKFRERVNR